MKNLIIAAVLLIPAAAGAQQNLKIGNMEVNPFMSTLESYDNNIYLTKTATKGSSINRSSLGFGLIEKIGSRLNLAGGYSMEVLGYSRAPVTNDAVHHNANVSATAKLPKEATITLDDKYKQTTDQATSETTARALRVENTVGLNVAAPLRGKFGFGVALQHIYNNYLNVANKALDREETLAGFDVDYKLQPKTKLFFNYRYGNLVYQASDVGNAVTNNMDVGLTGDIAPKIVGTVKAGMQMRSYENALATAKDEINTAGYSAQAVWTPMAKSEVIIYGKRGNVESSYGLSRFYTSSLIDLTITRQVNKIKAGLGLSYEGVLYPEKTTVTGRKRLDENASVRLTAVYNMQKWLTADFAYTYKDRTSNYDVFEYKSNVISLGIKALF
ncbi:MAG: outer membrane beta-barrel protein [Elusimicrobiota bacterium]|nr:outer membrane beta-barrel protein [Elusimicrobiota bacterium]